MTIVWAVLFLLFLFMEANTVSVVSIWFALGALAAEIACLCGGQLWLQVVLFLVLSGVLLAALRPITKKYFTPKLTKTNVDAVVGTTGKVILTIDNDASQGKVTLGAMEWTARSTNGSVIEAGTLIRVDKIEGVKVFVSPAEVKNNV